MTTLQPSLRLSRTFDASRLQRELDLIVAEEYVPHFNTQYYSGEWSAVPLRSVGGRARHIYPDPTAKTAFADTPLLERCPYAKEILSSLECPQQAVRYLRLKPGSVVKPHTDLALSFGDGEVRLHIPVRTNPDVHFVLEDKRVVMSEGECWYLDLTRTHSVENRGATDRVHLVIDCVVNDWLRNLLLSEAARSALS
jgi:hypothetical protein